MRVTVCQLSAEVDKLDNYWQQLVEHAIQHRSDLVLLPEMPFYPWICSLQTVDERLWEDAVDAHVLWNQKLPELKADIVIGTRPVIDPVSNKRHNTGHVWSADLGIQDLHEKVYLPDEEGFWEASWYDRGEISFQVFSLAGITIGFSICTELWFMEHAREYAKQGIHFLVCPRATPLETVDKWIAGGRAAAVVSGAFCISSNHQGVALDKKTILGGVGWVIDPEGNVLGKTDEQNPFKTLEIDVSIAEKAKSTYPRYVIG
ncbi:MAG: carbon-nitrogen hydrolase family protein [Candidatus Hodarchaeales archaeon]|jgi:N-carbamoylputrescine amidase